MYKLNVGAFPSKLQDLSTQPAGMDLATWGGPYLGKPVVKDAWSQHYKYMPDERNNTVLIQSAGPDGQMGSQDDITNQ